jgi:hypothetical protein
MPKLQEVERYLRIATYLKFLFGSGRGSVVVLLLIGVIFLIGFATMRIALNPEPELRKADKVYANDKIEGVLLYKQLLEKRDFWDPSQPWLTENRARLYRRIISFEVRYGARDEARDYIHTAWKEGLKDLSFEDEDSQQLWKEVTEEIRQNFPMNSVSAPGRSEAYVRFAASSGRA